MNDIDPKYERAMAEAARILAITEETARVIKDPEAALDLYIRQVTEIEHLKIALKTLEIKYRELQAATNGCC